VTTGLHRTLKERLIDVCHTNSEVSQRIEDLEEINNNLAELRTTMTLIQWVGGPLGLLILGLLWKVELSQIPRRPNRF
jgi:hypothetical protein